MNFLDILIAIPLGYLIYKGYRRGLIFELASLLGVILGSILAVRFAHWFATILGIDGENAYLIAFFVIFLLVIILSLFLAKMVERFVKLVHVGALNNIAGAIFGLMKGVCILGVLIYYVTIIDLEEEFLTRDVKEHSLLYHPIERSGKQLAGRMDLYLEQRKQVHEDQENGIDKQ